MPRIKSAEKRMRQTKTRTARNRATRSELRTAIKRVRTAATPAESAAALKLAEQMIDRAGRKNIVHRNTAARDERVGWRRRRTRRRRSLHEDNLTPPAGP